MKPIIVIALSLVMSGCSLFGSGSKRAPEIVSSCFSDGENQSSFCKAQRVNEDGRIVVTRCIGSLNQEARPALRGKCVEKTCSEGSNTDCQVKGEFSVLEQYAELVTANLFVADEMAQAKKNMSVKGKGKARAIASVAVANAPVPTPTPVPEPITSTPEKNGPKVEPAEQPSMKIVLRPAKKSRAPVSLNEIEKGFKKVCISKKEMAAPEVLRGKCATRNCAKGKCQYQGRKEMFDWVARRN